MPNSVIYIFITIAHRFVDASGRSAPFNYRPDYQVIRLIQAYKQSIFFYQE